MSAPPDRSWVPDWLPEWLPWQTSGDVDGDGERSDRLVPTDNSRNSILLQDLSTQAASFENESADSRHPNEVSHKAQNDGGIVYLPPKTVVVQTNRERTVRRRLRGLHLFMITINGTLGTGLYWRGGQILELGGQLAVLLSFLLLGLLAWAVMQCISEMLCIWPISGALAVYVSEFVDMELGLAVGIAYWYTYSVSFSALLATVAAEVQFWTNSKSVEAGIIFILLPIVLVFVNAFEVEIYGFVEIVTGSIKLLFLAIIAIALVAIKAGASSIPPAAGKDWGSTKNYDSNAAQSWGVAFLMSLSIASFAFVGIEIVAASALEARWPQTQTNANPTTPSRPPDVVPLIGNTVKFSAIWISCLATIAYTVSGFLASLDIDWNNCRLPRLSWVDNNCTSSNTSSRSNTYSVFVIIAQNTRLEGFDHVFNFFLVFTALSCASTNLYVASRSLFSLTSRINGGSGQPWHLRLAAYFGKTNKRKVPVRAMLLSAVAFLWVPFLQLENKDAINGSKPINMFIDVLAEMGSIGVIIVWGCECWAFIRFFYCIKRHQRYLKERNMLQVQRWNFESNDYPYRSHGQPVTAFCALAACLFLILIANGAALWKQYNTETLLSAYLTPICFLLLWIFLKLVRGGKWTLVDLSNPEKVADKLRELNDICFRGVDEADQDPPTLWNFWGRM